MSTRGQVSRLPCFLSSGLCLSLLSLRSISSLFSNLGSLRNGALGSHRLHHELNHSHGGVVTLTVTNLNDAGVAAGTLRHCRGDHSEQLVHHRLIGNGTQHAASSSEIALLTESNETLRHRAHTLRLGEGGGDALVLEQLRRKVIEHQTLMGRGTAKARTLSGSRHNYFSIVYVPSLQ